MVRLSLAYVVSDHESTQKSLGVLKMSRSVDGREGEIGSARKSIHCERCIAVGMTWFWFDALAAMVTVLCLQFSEFEKNQLLVSEGI